MSLERGEGWGLSENPPRIFSQCKKSNVDLTSVVSFIIFNNPSECLFQACLRVYNYITVFKKENFISQQFGYVSVQTHKRIQNQ